MSLCYRSFLWAACFISGLTLFASGQISSNVTLLAQVNQYQSSGYNDCWGYIAPDGREYALLGVQTGTSILDITDTGNIVEVNFIPSAGSLWKDIKTYQTYAYVVNESSGGMQIIDLSDLPNSAPLINTYTGFQTSHNIYVDEAAGILYAEGNSSAVVRVMDLADPVNPVQIASLGQECHDIYARNGLLVVSEGFSGSFGFWDVSNPANPQFLQRINVPSPGYCHNAWFSDDGNYMMTTEETAGKTVKMWDISDLSNVSLEDDILGPNSLAHNAHIKGDYAYVSEYEGGMRIYDISDPANLSEAGFYDSYPSGNGSGFNGDWGAYPFFKTGKVLISDMQTGLYVIFFAGAAESIPLAPKELTAYSDYTTPTSMNLEWVNPTKLISGDTLTAAEFSSIIKRNNIEVATVPGTDHSFTDTGLIDGVVYTYSVAARNDATGDIGEEVSFSWTAGGAKEPSAASGFSISGNQSEITVLWTSPNTNIDGTPMDDYAGINLYQNGILVTTFSRSAGDTSAADQDTYQPATPDFYEWSITVVDNEVPANESTPSAGIGTPLGLPITDAFTVAGPPNAGIWLNSNAEVNDRASNPPNGSLALNLNGTPTGEDIVDLKPVDLSSQDPVYIEYFWQPQGNGNAPEPGDSLLVYLKNDLGEWILVRSYAGTTVQPFALETIVPASENAAGGTFFHGQFQIRFRSIGGAGAFPNDDWFVASFILEQGIINGVEDETAAISQFELHANYPNPFNPSTTLAFSLGNGGDITLTIFNALGQTVRELVNETYTAGRHTIVWNGLDETGRQASSGIYFYRLQSSEGLVQTRKMMLIK